MLLNIYIKNFIIIDEKKITFEKGLNVLSGETGAGKSILIDALGLQLGGRSDSDWIRKGSKRCDILSEYNNALNESALKWLNNNEFDDESGNCQLRRTISENGKSKCYINGVPTTVGSTKEIGKMLVNIHGQHSHQTLTSTEKQLELLDNYADNSKLLKYIKKSYIKWQSLIEQQRVLSKDSDNLFDKLNYIQFQLKEIEDLNIEVGEFDLLSERQKQLSSRADIVNKTNNIIQLISDDSNLSSCFSQLKELSNKIVELDSCFSNTDDLLNQTLIYLDESRESLNNYINSLDEEYDSLEVIENRMANLYDISRKHRIDVSDLSELENKMRNKESDIKERIDKSELIDADIKKAKKEYDDLATQLSNIRKKTVEQLIKEVNSQLSDLDLKDAKFNIELKKASPKINGKESIVFMFSPNPGQDYKPLHKIASGGELSRISLAIQVASISKKSDTTLIFDEVDSGVGGATAEAIGRLLKILSRYNQIICVTHLPQVAAFADNHIKINKQVINDETTTDFISLDENDRVEELARMSGGIVMDKKTREHAQNLLDNALQFTSKL